MPLPSRLLPPEPDLVARGLPHVQARIAALGPEHWTYLVAPAGFGKSTQAAFAVQRAPAALWLRASPNLDLLRWIGRLADGLDALADGAGAGLRLWNRDDDPAGAADAITDGLDEACQACTEGVTIVVDDYHWLPVQADNVFENLFHSGTPNVRWIVLSRRCPTFVRSHTASSRLSLLETNEFRLDREDGRRLLQPSASTISNEPEAALLDRLEGWPAGLRLARLVISGAAQASTEAEVLARLDAHILDYFEEAVLARLAPALREFVLRTVLLPFFEPDLARELAGTSVSPDEARAAGVFLERVPGSRPVYRYHDLFRRLTIPQLPRWLSPDEHERIVRGVLGALARDGRLDEAVTLASELDALQVLLPLVEAEAPEAIRKGNARSLIAWTDPFPHHGAIGVARACGLLLKGRIPEAHALIRLLEHDPAVKADARLDGERCGVEAIIQLGLGNEQAARTAFERAHARLPNDCDDLRCVLDVEQSAFLLRRGALDDAETLARRAVHLATQERNIVIERAAWWILAELQLHRGDLQGARASHQVAFDQNADAGPQLAAAGLAETYRELSGDFECARNMLTTLLADARRAGSGTACLQACVGAARLSASEGRFDEAEGWLDEGDMLAQRTGLAECITTLQAYRTSFRLRQGISAVATKPDATAAGTVFLPNHAPEHIELVWARTQLARNLDRLNELEAAATREGRERSRLEIGMVRARAQAASGHVVEAHESLARIVEAGKAAGFRRLFLDEPWEPELRPLILEAFGGVPAESGASPLTVSNCPLSTRELEVLSLIAQGHTNASCSRLLFVAPSTVKKHLENIYRRLQADNRMHAIAIARDAGWMPTY